MFDLKTKEAEDMADVLKAYGEWAYGMEEDLHPTAAEWVAAGFTPEEADVWLEAGFWKAGLAAKAKAAGADVDAIDSDLAYSYCNGDASLEELL